MKYQLEHCIGSRLRRLSRIADGHIRKFLGNYGITENQMTILFALHELGHVEQGKVGEVLCLERSTVSRSIKLLEKKNLVLKTISYRPEVELTKEGMNLVKTLIPEWEKAMDILVGQLEESGLKSLQNLENHMR
ncbi:MULTISPECIES: MarR family winged helix-turn-helix transcriptional regulator [Flavobacteriaceae]|uniref:MarR family winged helix-turn-helix transcriptional regulator n=1 Tax=Flavobacteriaceae TaxID=49546 RepID=UPI001490A3B6|nr:MULTISPECIES: MarR family transcriptional regulator [Allomuricauda]MDC6367529.1 MarR family transcriptional regulator [Muricauda sp. AC10]